jgi:hypothetical protein
MVGIDVDPPIKVGAAHNQHNAPSHFDPYRHIEIGSGLKRKAHSFT